MKIPLKQFWLLLSKYFKAQRGKLVLLALLLFSGIGIQLINPQIIRHFIDTATSGGTTQSLILVALTFIVMTVIQQILAVGTSYVGEDVGWVSTNLLRQDLARHCFHLDMAFHHEHTPGAFIERIDGDVTMLANFFSRFTLQVMGNLLLLVGIVVLLFREDWRVGLAMGSFALVTLVTLARLSHFATPYWQASRQSSADFYGFLEERLAGTEDLRANGAIAYTMRRFYASTRAFFNRELRANIMSTLAWGATTVLITAGNATALLVGAYLFQSGALTIGAVYLVFHYTNMLIPPLQSLIDEIDDLQRANAGIARIQEFLAVQAETVDGTEALPEGALSLAFQDVSFTYTATSREGTGNRQENEDEHTVHQASYSVLTNLSFQLKPGTVLGLVGRTGSGKTTISRLILRLYEPQSGQIRLGDVDVRHVQLANLRQRVGIVTQTVQLFHATLRDNLTFFDRSIADERILAAFKDLGLWDWFQTLPEGLDTQLESGGGNLSMGEAQLLVLVRVFIKDPGLVILDEASSRLDPATERRIERAIDKLLSGRTAIIIAHRLATLQRVDEILVLDQGQLSEWGARERLATDHTSRFYQLLQTDATSLLQSENANGRS